MPFQKKHIHPSTLHHSPLITHLSTPINLCWRCHAMKGTTKTCREHMWEWEGFCNLDLKISVDGNSRLFETTGCGTNTVEVEEMELQTMKRLENKNALNDLSKINFKMFLVSMFHFLGFFACKHSWNNKKKVFLCFPLNCGDLNEGLGQLALQGTCLTTKTPMDPALPKDC